MWNLVSATSFLIVFWCQFGKMKSSELLHRRCRNSVYAHTKIMRFCVPDEMVPWSTVFPDYKPVDYESPTLAGKPWADPLIGDPAFNPKWNQRDGLVNRASYIRTYSIENGRPLNPSGRTGIVGRGLLGRWGPNHAADALVTRWSRGIDGSFKTDTNSGRKILQMVAIQRRDNNMWAMPGGMLDANETSQTAAKREFTEEALNEAPAEDIAKACEFFDASGKQIYAGYVDDPRNTDNAWTETVAFNFHDESGENVASFHFRAGDDAKNLRWEDISGSMELHASHRDIIKIVVDELGAHW